MLFVQLIGGKVKEIGKYLMESARVWGGSGGEISKILTG
jgi:hypothetical protein